MTSLKEQIRDLKDKYSDENLVKSEGQVIVVTFLEQGESYADFKTRFKAFKFKSAHESGSLLVSKTLNSKDVDNFKKHYDEFLADYSIKIDAYQPDFFQTTKKAYNNIALAVETVSKEKSQEIIETYKKVQDYKSRVYDLENQMNHNQFSSRYIKEADDFFGKITNFNHLKQDNNLSYLLKDIISDVYLLNRTLAANNYFNLSHDKLGGMGLKATVNALAREINKVDIDKAMTLESQFSLETKGLSLVKIQEMITQRYPEISKLAFTKTAFEVDTLDDRKLVLKHHEPQGFFYSKELVEMPNAISPTTTLEVLIQEVSKAAQSEMVYKNTVKLVDLLEKHPSANGLELSHEVSKLLDNRVDLKNNWEHSIDSASVPKRKAGLKI